MLYQLLVIYFTQYVVIWKLPNWLVGQNITIYWLNYPQKMGTFLNNLPIDE